MATIDLVALRDRCLTLIDDTYDDPGVSPTRLARALFVSRRQLDRAFAGGPSVVDELARRRLQQVVACAAQNPSVPMAEIARGCGYGTYETFRAQCHKHLRCSPREARRIHAMARMSVGERRLAA